MSKYMDGKLDDSGLEDVKLFVEAHNSGDLFEV